MRKGWLPILIFLPCLLQAQEQWAIMDSAYGLGGTGAHLYFAGGPLEGAPSRAWYLEVPRGKGMRMDVDTARARRITPSEFSRRNGTPLAVINTTFFSFATSANLNLVVDEGRILAHSPHSAALKGSDSGQYLHYLRSAIGFDRKGRPDIAWLYSDQKERKAYAFQSGPLSVRNREAGASLSLFRDSARPRKWKVRSAVGGGPVLIQAGQVRITNNEERMFAGSAVGDRHPRTALGYRKDGTLILLVVEGRQPGRAEGASLTALAGMLLRLGCTEAINMDGGGSTCLLVQGRRTNHPSDGGAERPVPAVLMVVKQ